MKSILFFLLVISVLQSNATNIRGQVVRYNPTYGNYYPMAGIRVDLWVYNGQWLNIAYSVTDNSGMYYFYNMSPGFSFQVQVFGVFYPPQPLIVHNLSPGYFQDVAFITI